MTDAELSAFCKDVPPFHALPDRALAELLSGSRVKNFAAKEHLFFEGEDGEAGYLVLSGRVALVKTSPSGREIIMELLPAGQLFGIVVLVQNRPYPLTARTQSEAELLVIPRTTITAAMEANPSILQGFLAVVSQRLQSAHNVARSLAHDKVEVRIASAILALLGKVPVVEIGRQELADLTGTTIETASRVCKLWEREGIVALPEQGTIVVNDAQRLSAVTRPE